MTSSSVERFGFDITSISALASLDARFTNWPVVYVIDGDRGGKATVYVGETVNARNRMIQHLQSGTKAGLRTVRIVLDDRFNKSVCLDLESHLIRWLAGDGAFTVLNGNEGIIDAAYYDRTVYRESFRDIFESLRSEGVFQRSIPEIENSDLFKLSPFKALTSDQAIAVEDIVEGLLEDVADGPGTGTSVVRGNPGTGKTIVAIFLLKLLADIKSATALDDIDPDRMFSEFFTTENRNLLENFRMGFVVPQQSLRKSIQRVFRLTPGLDHGSVLSPFEVGKDDQHYDLLIVDEAHRLSQRANQPSAAQNAAFRDINERLFGADDSSHTQLDWIRARSTRQILLLDEAQSVRPADLPTPVLHDVVETAKAARRYYPLTTQMRVRAGADYVEFVRGMLRGEPRKQHPSSLGDYDLRFFDDLGTMRREILARDDEQGLARLVAGYAWEWKSKGRTGVFDIELDGEQLVWNTVAVDWINSPTSREEVGSIHTVQGYDLNYAGVIIGPDLRFDAEHGQLFVDRNAYQDRKGKENNPTLGRIYSDDDLLVFIRNIYAVLLTRGMRGTYVYVCDPALRAFVRAYLAR